MKLIPRPVAIAYKRREENPVVACVRSNAHDLGASLPFTDDAVVHDENHDHRGFAAIRAWKTETTRKYHPTVEVLDVAQEAGRTIVKGKVSGTFPGSPVELRYAFTLKGEKIARLEIVP